MNRIFTLTLFMMALTISSFAQIGTIAGPSFVCPGSSITVTDSASLGGTWTSSNTSVATIGSSSGAISGVAAGTATITYTHGTYITTVVTVEAMPVAITGGGSALCPGASTTLTDATSGGTWTSDNTFVATVGSTTGFVTAVAGGYATIEYSIGTTCNVYVTVTVSAPPDPIFGGPSSVCSGSTITMTDSSGIGIVWSSSNTAIATVGSTGIVTGVSAGTANISLTGPTVCTTHSTHTWPVTVLSSTSAGAIVGASSSVTVGLTGALSNPTSSSGPYTWSSTNPSVATVGSSSGVVYGVSAGTTTISYGVTGCSGLAYTSASLSVVSLSGISGYVTTSSPYSGPLTVYLIYYNPSTFMLSAFDSVYFPYTACGVGQYFQFTGLPTDSFRVKAAMDTTMTAGYIPTYHTSHFYWHDADVIYHISGNSDINENITMLAGTSTTGPGFIGGSVFTGANRGTSSGIPVVGLPMYIVNSATGNLMGVAHTNTSGDYSYSNLPVGETYYVFPDSLNYLTTPYTSISLTSSNPSLTVADFIENTLSGTITPVMAGVKNTVSTVSSVVACPNPTTGSLNVQWYETSDENATISVTDITGREVYKRILKLSQGAGNMQIDMSEFTNGLYLLSVKSGNLSYNNKIELAH